MTKSLLCEPREVFTYSGYIAGSPSSSLARGLGLATSAEDLIEVMQEAGLIVVAVSSLEDINRMIEQLVALRDRSADMVRDEDYLVTDGMAGHRGTIESRHVFTFVGAPPGRATAFAGLMLAESEAAVVHHLASFGFAVRGMTSLADLLVTQQELIDTRHGRLEESQYIDLLGSTAGLN